MTKLKTNILEYRNEAQISQEQLANLVGVRRETIGRLEKGLYNPSLKLAMDIAKIFHVSVEQLFEFGDESKWM